MDADPVACVDSGCIARTLLLLLHRSVEACLIDRHALLAEDECRQVQREAVGVVEDEGGLPAQHLLALALALLDLLVQ